MAAPFTCIRQLCIMAKGPCGELAEFPELGPTTFLRP